MNKTHIYRYRVFGSIGAMAVASALAGCGVELLATTAIRGELDAQQAKSATKHIAYVKDKMGGMGVEQAIQAYRAEHGQNPPSLDALVPTYLPEMPRRPDGGAYAYDPVSGALHGGDSMAADRALMESIRQAINQYGTATGYYPPTLDDLYPQYLSQLPRTSAGELFIYNNQNGYLEHPRPQGAVRPAAPRPASGVSGSGPMGEMMTGIGIQQELGRMSTGGASAAQTRVRSGADGIADRQTSQQNQVMDQLGL